MCKLRNSMIVVLTLLVVVAFVPPFNTRAAAQATPTPTPAPSRTPSPPPEGNDQRAAALLEQGIENIETEDYEQAIENFDKAIELDPNLAVAYLYRGIAHAGSRNWEQAIADLEHYLELAPDAPDRDEITSYVETLRTGGLSRTVLAWLISAEELNSFSNDVGITGWELVDELPGQFRTCRIFAGASWSAAPNSATNCVNSATPGSTFEEIVASLYDMQILYPTDIALEPSFDYSGNFALYAYWVDNGHAAYEAFLLGDGVLFRASVDVGTPAGYSPELLFEEHGQIIEAFLHNILIANLEKSGQGALFDALVYHNRGNFFHGLQDYEQAITDYTRVIDLDPEDARNYFERGATYYRLDEYEQAVADYTQALKLDPDYTSAHINLAWTLAVDLGTDYETALKHAQRAVELDPGAATHFTLAMVNYKLEQYAQAPEH